jgi:hypothetical protein
MTAEYASQANIGSAIANAPPRAVSAQAASTNGIARTIDAKAQRHRLK